MSDEEAFDRIVQTEIDQTAPVVYEAARRALESDKSSYRAALLHEEDTHVNLGRTLEWIPEVEHDLQFRRPGGGGYVVHEDAEEGAGTYCFIDARVKDAPKEMTSLQRDRMAYETLGALQRAYENIGVIDGDSYIQDLEGEVVPRGENAAYYDPGEGDIYLQERMMPRYDDPQIAGIGLAEIEIDDEWVQIGRVCMYPDGVSQEAIELDEQIREGLELDETRSLDERIEPTQGFEEVRSGLESDESREMYAEEFLSQESISRGEDLQEQEGLRPGGPCF